ncbi:protein SEEDLING PLASTID DEVELOPMENT 1 isoform X3 [Magnolia sinica]|uniref:protein SEEDLING PLASTID DEVELOPMENT 1 isoform X3 n=1 Tax=Magnolia sinica TaxID=86752 RepID=UPI00265854D4|nr:protein SEEDLING PLASTID DEVELOPMENT 1 isoform X3 [Magnolia sinica]
MRMLALPREGLIAPMLQLPLPPPTPTKQTFRTSQQKSASLRSQPFSVCYKCKFISSPISSFPKSPTKRLNSCSNSSAPTTDDDFDVELGRLLALLPDEMRRKVSEHPDRHHLIEIVMDLGRTPLARFPSGDFVLSDQPITFADLEHATSQVGDFATDNRAGISRTLHRISAIRNRKGVIIGLTCRVGRAISGSANLLRDLVKDGDSLLLIGPPGVGKTTIIREIARMLADDHSKRVMIVDTSNEIGGDGDIPHEGIGAARRMQVPNSDMQHKSVTLGDEEASRRGVQKTVLERRGPSTFTCGVEIISKTELRVHRSLEATVDALLSGRSPNFEVCKINSQGFAHEMVAVPIEPFSDISSHEQDEIVDGDLLEINDERISYNEFTSEFAAKMEEIPSRDEVQLHLYVYGILEASVVQAIKGLRMDDVVELTDNISKADAFLALFSKLKKNPRIQAVAKSHDIPIYVTKTSSLLQITKAIRAFVSKHADGFKDLEAEDKMSSSEKIDALEEARLAIEQIVIPKGEPVELLPRSPAIRSLQMDLAKKYQLQSEKVGEEPDARVCILPLHAARTEGNEFDDGLVDSVGNFNNSSSPSDINGSCNSMTKLPFLPD